MNKAALRTDWTDYARQHGLLRTESASDAKPSKYRNVPVVVHGERFASKREAQRWHELQLRLRAGEICALKRQQKWPLWVMSLIHKAPLEIRVTQIGTYIDDAQYYELPSGEFIVEDSKGVRTDVYKLKAKLMHAIYGITIREV